MNNIMLKPIKITLTHIKFAEFIINAENEGALRCAKHMIKFLNENIQEKDFRILASILSNEKYKSTLFSAENLKIQIKEQKENDM